MQEPNWGGNALGGAEHKAGARENFFSIQNTPVEEPHVLQTLSPSVEEPNWGGISL